MKKLVKENEKMKKLLKIDGITLIALIVTIVILLVLAGIAIMQLNNNGLLKNTKIAKERYTNAQKDENATIDDYSNQIKDYSTFIDTNFRDSADFSSFLNSLVFVKQTSTLTTRSGKINTTFSLDKGKYLIIASCKSNEYSGKIDITGDDNIKFIKNFYYSNYDVNYGNGRGFACVSLYVLNTEKQVNLIFSLEPSYSGWGTIGSAAAFEFKLQK